MLKEFFIKKQLQKMGLNDKQLSVLMTIIKNNPALFQQLAKEVEDKVSQDKISYDEAVLTVMNKHQPELVKIFSQPS